jgi:hypothetical protein
MRKRLLIALAVAIGALGAAADYQHARSDTAGWQEITWPFPRDGWPAGRAFHCGAASCGDDVVLYVRPKIGFCNCDSGVADDDEVDRVADLDLISERFAPRAVGQITRIAGMQGRLRSYDLGTAGGAGHTAVGIAVSHRCNLLVAAAQGSGDATQVQRVALAFLGSGDMANWMAAAMDGR